MEQDENSTENIHMDAADASLLTARTFHRVRGEATERFVAGLSPQDIRKAYCFDPDFLGGGFTIAIVGAFNYPTALGDFNVFSTQFGLPVETSANALAATNKVFQVINAKGTTPPLDAGWALESALDTQWAHALAPLAKIVLVQAASNTFVDLFQAVDVANAVPNVIAVSMSWGGSEFAGETAFDAHMKKPGVVYLAGAGDIGGQTLYPSASQFAVSVGGTRLNYDECGELVSETAWADGGGGPSIFVPIPVWQARMIDVASKSGAYRGTPDVAFDADMASGVAIYDSTPYNGLSGWLIIGGTSLGTPCWAAIAGLMSETRAFASTGDFCAYIYSLAGKYRYDQPQCAFFDITEDSAGAFSAMPGWDFCTGLGAPRESRLVSAAGEESVCSSEENAACEDIDNDACAGPAA